MKIKHYLLSAALAAGFAFGEVGTASAFGDILDPILGPIVAIKGEMTPVASVGAPCGHRRHRCGRGFHGACGWPYGGGDTIYFALGNGWPFGCYAGRAGGWPYYHGVGVAGRPGGMKFGFVYNFRPYAICRQNHGPRFCRSAWPAFAN
jgi:hypothetical protein